MTSNDPVPALEKSYRDVLVIVPARRYSRRLPGKNLAAAAGRPVAFWSWDRVVEALGDPADTGWRSVAASDDSRFLDLMVSRVTETHWLSPNYTRPEQTIEPVLRAVLKDFEATRGWKVNVVVCLEPCVPVAPWEYLRLAVHGLLNRGRFGAAFAVEPTAVPHWSGPVDEQGGFLAGPTLWKSRDSLPPLWTTSGAAFVYAADWLRIRGGNPPVLAVRHGAGEVVSIDTAADLERAEAILRSRAKQ